MAVDILGGTNFLIKNDTSPRMAKGTISIGNSCTVLAASPTLLALDKLDTRLRLIKVTEHVKLVPGEYATLSLPPDLPRDRHLVMEPKQQKAPFVATVTKYFQMLLLLLKLSKLLRISSSALKRGEIDKVWDEPDFLLGA